MKALHSNRIRSLTIGFVIFAIISKPVVRAQDRKLISEPLVTHIYTADPSAHVFNGKIYIYPSHD